MKEKSILTELSSLYAGMARKVFSVREVKDNYDQL